MGKDVFGTERFRCSAAGCTCTSYLCVIDTMSDEERAMTVVHHPRNHPGYTTCSCGHGVAQHADKEMDAAVPLAAQGELTKCPACASRTGACKQPGESGHLLWTNAYCPKCFTKPNPRGCKSIGQEGHWTEAAAARAAEAS
jgi:hypothetical protein